MNRTRLGRNALEGAVWARRKAGVGGMDPVCPYEIARELGVRVDLREMGNEGLYVPDGPLIQVNASRPGGRQRYTCAHEVGHHWFGHGYTADEAVGRGDRDDPNEFVADAFAGHLLMPKLGVLRAFQEFGTTPGAASPAELYAVACEFGVGYGTLATHLAFVLGGISRTRWDAVRGTPPKAIRAAEVPGVEASALMVIRPEGRKRAYDVVAGEAVLAVIGRGAVPGGLRHVGAAPSGEVYLAERPGEWALGVGSRVVTVRVAKPGAVGLARYRHLEDSEWTSPFES